MKKYSSIVLKETFRNKSNISLMSILIICIFLMIFCFDVKENLKQYIDNYTTGNIGLRTLITMSTNSTNEEIEKLKSLDHVLYADYSLYNASSFSTDSFNKYGFDGKLNLRLGVEEILPPVLFGNSFKKEDTSVAICPMNLYPDKSIKEIKNLDISKTLTKEQTLNSTFVIDYNSYHNENGNYVIDQKFQKKFKIIGLYDNLITSSSSNECFISEKDMKEIINQSNEEKEIKSSSILLIADSYENIPELKQNLKNMGIESSLQVQIKTSFIKTIELCLQGIILLSFITSIVLIILNIYKKILTSQNIIAAKLSIGYQKKDIVKFHTIEIILMVLMSCFIASFLYVIIYFILNQILLDKLYLMGFQYIVKIPNMLLIILGTVLITCLISYVQISILLKNKDILELMKEE